jgi:LysR family glycine cleavage system transcriptional activator
MRRLPSLIALRFFEETAQHLSFNRAAPALCVTQGAVSKQIRQLEASLGVDLFERDHTGIHLTSAGLVLVLCLTEAFDMIERGTIHLSAEQEPQRLVVSLPPTFATQWFSPRVGELSAQLAGVDLSLRTQPSDRCHCVVRFGQSAPATGRSELLMAERNTLVVAARSPDRSIQSLLDTQPALHVLHDERRLPLWRDWLAHANLPAHYANGGIEFSNLAQAIEAVRCGVGLAIVDLNMIASELNEDMLRRVSDVEVRGPFGYWLDVPDRFASAANVRAFSEWIKSEAG